MDPKNSQSNEPELDDPNCINWDAILSEEAELLGSDDLLSSDDLIEEELPV